MTAKPSPKSKAPPQPAEPPMCRVLIVEDHAIVRRGIRALLETQPGFQVVGEAEAGTDAVQMAQKLRPHIIVLDLTLPELTGLEAIQQIRQNEIPCDFVVLTMHYTVDVAREALKLGVMAYVLKSDADMDLLVAIDHVRHGEPFFTPQLSLDMADNFVNLSSHPHAAEMLRAEAEQRGEPALTERQSSVVQLLAQGKSNKEIGVELNVSTRTVESHRHHINQKLGFHSFSELIRYAVRMKLIDP